MRKLALLMASTAMLPAADIAGSWNFKIVSFGEEISPAKLELKVDGNKLSGNLNELKLEGTVEGDTLCVAHGHLLRVLAARWIEAESMVNSRRLMLTTASLSALGYEESRSRPVIRFWNDTHHVAA